MFLLSMIAMIAIALIVPMFFAAFLPLTVIIFFALGLYHPSLNHPWQKTIIRYIFFLSLILLMSCLYSLKPGHSFMESLQMVMLLICFALQWLNISEIRQTLHFWEKKIVLWSYLVSILILMVFLELVSRHIVSFEPHKLNRHLVIFTLLIWPIIACANDPKLKYLIWANIGLTLLATLLGNSETALIMITCGVLVYLFIHLAPGEQFRSMFFKVGLLSILLLPILIASSETIADWLNPLIEKKQVHFLVWTYSWDKMIEAMPWGIGIDMTFVSSADIELFKGTETVLRHPHNIIMQMGRELGIIGLLVFCTLVYFALQFYRRTHITTQPHVAAFLISNAILFSLAFGVWQEWRIGSICCCLLLFKQFIKSSKDQTESH